MVTFTSATFHRLILILSTPHLILVALACMAGSAHCYGHQSALHHEVCAGFQCGPEQDVFPIAIVCEVKAIQCGEMWVTMGKT